MEQEAKKILLIGAGGHCLSVLDSLLNSNYYFDIGIIDRRNTTTKDLMGIPVLGNDDDLEFFYRKGFKEAFITIGSIGDTSLRKNMYENAKKIGFHFPNIIDKTSVISQYSKLGEGIYVGKNTVINAYADIGNMAIINTSSTIEHDCIISDFVHIAPGSILCGNVQIEEGTHIGAGSIVKQGVSVGSKTIIGIGSVVISDITSNATAYGNPCREVKVIG